MTIRTTKPAINLREELASLRNQGGYSEQQFYFDSLVTDGGMTLAATSASPSAGWDFTSDMADVNTTVTDKMHVKAGTTGYTWNIGGTLADYTKSNVLKFTVSNSSANVGVQLYLTSKAGAILSGIIATYTANGDYTVTLPPNSASADFVVAFYRLASRTGTLEIDGVSAFESDGTDVIHTMPKGWKPKDVFEDGLLQREGSGEDYTVIDNGFDYIIKPAVAPSATTQTCVIGVRK